MIPIECATCGTHDEINSLKHANGWVRRHLCFGKPYPLRVNQGPPIGEEAGARQCVRWEDLREDVEWLADSGVGRDEIVRRVGVTWDGILRAYRRHGVSMRPNLLGVTP